MKYYTISLILILFSCSNQEDSEWRQKYYEKQNYRIEYFETTYKYTNSKYEKESESKHFKGFDSENRIINYSNHHFYEYNSLGKLSKEVYCLRTCDNPVEEFYNYSEDNLLINRKLYHPAREDTILLAKYNYESELLKLEIAGRKAPFTTVKYKYDNSNKLIKKSVNAFNTNVNEWINSYDTIFYDDSGKKIRKDHFVKGKDLQKVTKYYYEGENLIREIDTTFTSIISYQLNKERNTVHHAYYGKRDYKYDNEGKLIEKIIFQPDYETPYIKIEYKEEIKTGGNKVQNVDSRYF